MKQLRLSIFFALLCTACASVPYKKIEAPKDQNQEQSILTREDAQLRSAKISNVKYDLTVRLNETATYAGEQNISFTLSDASADIRVDFFKGDIKKITVNDQNVNVLKTPTFFWLPQAALKAGTNLVRISYTTEMQTNGTGLHRFQDPEDKNIFLYTQFEAFDAHKFMPCFDQPDLKATLQLQVEAPKTWTVVSTARENSVEELENGNKLWDFPETAPISTYLFSLHAGPFKVWKDSFGKIPLRLLARPSLAKYIPVKLWFSLTKKGLGFYNSYFAYPYPFKKYDQLIVPELNAGAMENVGAVTFSERLARRGKITRDDELSLADVILHEMAHMWFGDLVTMRWWNDLWLNESFATYMSSLAIAKSTKYNEVWKNFLHVKLWAYDQDQLSTTHPIESHVKDTMEAFASFDGITYGKGASVLKQMNHWLTPQVFQKGVQAYMKNYAFQNAELKNFIGSLQQFSDTDFVSWSNAWLKQAGVDTLHSSFTCKDGKLESIGLQVTPQIPGEFRPQRIKIALYKKNKQSLQLLRSEEIKLTQALQKLEWKGACPDLVYPNLDDQAYIKVVLDAKSVETAKSSLSIMQDPLMRMMLWANFWQMVRDQDLSLADYAEIAEHHLEKENDLTILHMVMRSVTGPLLSYWPMKPEILNQKRGAFIKKLEGITWSRMEKSKAGSDEQSFWFDNFVSVAETPQSLSTITQLLEGSLAAPKGFTIDQDRRWTILNRLCRKGSAQCSTLVEREKKRDGSDRGQKSALAAEAIRPDLAVKENFYRQVVEDKNVSLQKKYAIAKSMFPYEQQDMAQNFEARYFQYLESNKHNAEVESLQLYARSFIPNNCTSPQSTKVGSFLAHNPDLPAPVTIHLKQALDEDSRCQKIRGKLSQALGLQ